MQHRVSLGLFGTTALSLAALTAGAAEPAFPSRPIHIIVSSAGSSGDVSVRLFSPIAMGFLGQPIVVENRPDVITVTTVAKAPPDGYTLLEDATSLWIGPMLRELPYDVQRDLTPITTTDRSPSSLALHPSVPANSVKEFIALAKSKPGALNYGSASPGSLSHLATELFKNAAGVDIVRVPFKSGGDAITGALTGQVQMLFNSVGTLSPQYKAGKLKLLGIASAQPSPLAPGTPTIASQGLPGFEATLIQGLFAPAKTPPAIVNRINQEVARALSSPELKDKYLNIGYEASPSKPEEFGALIKSEIAKWGKLIKDANIKVE